MLIRRRKVRVEIEHSHMLVQDELIQQAPPAPTEASSQPEPPAILYNLSHLSGLTAPALHAAETVTPATDTPQQPPQEGSR